MHDVRRQDGTKACWAEGREFRKPWRKYAQVLPLLRVHVTAYFCICSEQHLQIFTQRGIILVKK